MNNRIYTTRKVTVAGVPVTVTLTGHELAIRVGRFDPQAAAGRLRVNRLSGTAAVAVYVAGEGGPDGTGERWVAGLYPAAPGAAEQLLLCDGCFQAATGLLAECQDGCTRDLDHDGLCLRDSPDECQWCGEPGRLHEVPRAEHRAPPAHGGRRGRGPVVPALHRRHARPVPLGPGGLGLLARQRRRRDPRPV